MRYVLNRLLFLVVSIWAAITLNFILPRLMPGNPAAIMMAKFQGRMPPQALHALEIEMGMASDKPMIVQYFDYLRSMVTGHLGLSYTFYPTPVSAIIRQSLPWTIGLLGVAWLVAVVLGTLAGIWIAWRRGSKADAILPIGTMFFQSIPGFWLGLILLYFAGFLHNWFPTAHAYGDDVTPGFNGRFILSVLYHGFLPFLVVFLGSVSGWIVGMRNNMIMTLGEDYVVFAEAKGIPTRRLIFAYAARNALLPQVTSIAIALSTIIGGQILIEQVFSYPGIGYQLTNAVTSEDYPLIQGMFLIIAVATLVINFIVDMIYGRLDPRARRRGATS
ncbi:peptide ABC transporter permease [Alicyclobacillus cellulosilyticus]|uniref:Peptide ABC transporter permease n=1 Tax=Alicyclobacillus cellulosilyticus TaxID=1003997 RepID=A0A917K1U8_9BACL|nr:ABC transporter permease [Alicyclobacillus cellulosilyticus]GGI97770.1 peptide ABC transporter permease [Alicyclobacillus cellulosilyticus]